MPEDHGSTSIGGGLSEEMSNLMQHQDLPPSGFNDLPFRDGRRPSLSVIVAEHAERGRRGAQCIYYMRLADIAGVDDEL